MTKPEAHRDEPANLKESDFVTRADLKADEKPTEPTKTVNMTTPAGTKVQTSEDNAETLRDAGFS